MAKVYVETKGEWLGKLDFIEDGKKRCVLDNREVCAYNVVAAEPFGHKANVIHLTVGDMSMMVAVVEPPKKSFWRRVKDALSVLFQ